MKHLFKFLIFIFLALLSCNSNIKFDSEKWKNAGGENSTLDTRRNMSSDLLKTHILIDKNEVEIIELLGSPSRLQNKEVETTKYFAVKEVYDWNIDPEKLIFIKIEFNKKGKATAAQLFLTK